MAHRNASMVGIGEQGLKGTIHPTLLGSYALQVSLLVTELLAGVAVWVMVEVMVKL